MQLLFLTIEVATIVCALLLAARVLISRPRLPRAQLTAAIAFNTACSVVLAHQEYGYWLEPAFRIDVGAWRWILNLARNSTAGLFMLLCFTIFTDRRRFPRALLGLFAVQLILEEPARRLAPATLHALLTETAPALLQTLFVAIALYWTAVDWKADLIESRRRERAATLAVAGFIIVAFAGARVLIAPESHASFLAHVALTAVETALLAFVLLWVTRGDVGRHLDLAPGGRAPARPQADAAALARLTVVLEQERVWRDEGLTLRRLADRVGLPEYRLRRLIHEALGYRNFNALLHDHRIREACRQLSDPALRRTPILSIGLSVGYASINTFNRGFREIMTVTPSAYRAAALAAADAEALGPKTA